jgi:hypothetical protein
VRKCFVYKGLGLNLRSSLMWVLNRVTRKDDERVLKMAVRGRCNSL